MMMIMYRYSHSIAIHCFTTEVAFLFGLVCCCCVVLVCCDDDVLDLFRALSIEEEDRKRRNKN